MFMSSGLLLLMFVIFNFRPALQLFINRMHNSDGSFIMHDGGETDIR